MKPKEQATEAQQNSAILTDLPSVIFSLSGESARRWCNGMFSNNIRKLNPGQGNLSAICNDRGFVSNLIHCFCSSDQTFLCVFERDSLDPFLERFRSYLFLDDIELDELNVSSFSIVGPKSEEALELLGLKPPEEQLSREYELILLRVNRGIEGIDIYGPQPEIDRLRQMAVAKSMVFLTQEGFNLLRIRQGRAFSPDDIDDKTLIHNLGLNEICCAFDKGCYVGQEIINRIDVKGINNKLLHRFSIKGDATIGDTIMLNGQKVGKLSSIASDHDGATGLGIIRKSAWGKDRFTVGSGATLINLDV